MCAEFPALTVETPWDACTECGGCRDAMKNGLFPGRNGPRKRNPREKGPKIGFFLVFPGFFRVLGDSRVAFLPKTTLIIRSTLTDR